MYGVLVPNTSFVCPAVWCVVCTGTTAERVAVLWCTGAQDATYSTLGILLGGQSKPSKNVL